jgi:hypothetical protein
MAVKRILTPILQMSIVSGEESIPLNPMEIKFVEFRKDFSRIDICLTNNDIIMCGDCHTNQYTMLQTWCDLEKVDYRIVE